MDKQLYGSSFSSKKSLLKWLGRQRLDFYLPEYNIAIEYQGEQHFKPVKYFGGEKRYLDRLERDNRKKILCEENNVKIIYFSYWEKASSNTIKNENDLIKIIKNENI